MNYFSNTHHVWKNFLKDASNHNIKFVFPRSQITQTNFWLAAQKEKDEYVRIHYILPNETPVQFILRTCGTNCEMDCNIFNQFIMYLSKWDSCAQIQIYTIPVRGVSGMIRSMIIDDDSLYLGAKDNEVFENLMNLPTENKGQWLN